MIMSMHLIRGMSSIRTGKPSFKLTKKKRAEWEFDWIADNKQRKAEGMPKITFEDYCLNRTGKIKLPKPQFKTLSTVVSTHPRYLDRVQHQSLDVVAGNTLKREPLKYTGTLVKGIATMHKSNAVPVIDEEQMKEISRMRRG
jgi:hypothetical protein